MRTISPGPRRLRWLVLALGLALPVGLFPAPADGAAKVIAAECEFVEFELSRHGGTYSLSTVNPGLCVMKDLAYHLPQTAGLYVYASSIPASNVSCSGGRVRSVSAQVTLTLQGSATTRSFQPVSFGLTDPTGSSASITFLQLFTLAGAGQFTSGSVYGCPASGTVARWPLGSVVIEDPEVTVNA